MNGFPALVPLKLFHTEILEHMFELSCYRGVDSPTAHRATGSGDAFPFWVRKVYEPAEYQGNGFQGPIGATVAGVRTWLPHRDVLGLAPSVTSGHAEDQQQC